MSDLKTNLYNELSRIEEDSLYSMKGHYNASDRWRWWYNALGIINVICSVIAGITAFSEIEIAIKIAAIITAIVTALTTFLECSKKAESHKVSANSFLKIKNKARYLKEIKSKLINDDEFERQVNELLEQKDELNSISLVIPDFAYEKARAEIEKGFADYCIDKKKD
ncbi:MULTISPECIES: SLATT domain-containing protein [unclassified Neisseria]|uniref:SLATT domain-containing protein n=1 Tax=unclassified Neisseria TaxID=2623750 RepID=UPI002665062D|nr:MULTISPECIES: SLATT domain-containing protein [unclassified Neisseria]MDO1510774.1 SLATT domain-containing protein [Neisseria sp. MVDL19-042950]MDO1517115.1 SLATT domain-containing protein [Neisseria sp. MVDL18-041461]MDO1564426.1 SLATT domain-containing protein [Neisseria sp. MVDL20-010259]